MAASALPDLSSALKIDPSLIDAFERDGHVQVPRVASPEEVGAIRPVIKDVVDRVASQQDKQGRIDDYSRLFTQVTNIWRIDEAARQIVFARRFASVAAQLLRARGVRLYHDQALFKPAGADRTPWHQDRYYWPLDTDRTLTMWMPLVDVGEEMGPMTFASGSHRTSGLGELAISSETDQRLRDIVRERGWHLHHEPIRAGDATFHAGGTLHSAGANKSNRTREVLTIIYFADGARVAEPSNDNQRVDLSVFIPGAKSGDEAKSELNPLLYP